MKPTVKVKYTNGAGNNIFQYVYARLLAESNGCNLSTDRLSILDIEESNFKFSDMHSVIKISLDEKNFHKYMGNDNASNYVVHTYPEDYTIYKPHLDKIRSWFKDVPKVNTKDLVFHLRMGDRLLYKRDHHPSMKVSPEEYCEAINSFNYDRLHIVTDMPCFKKIDEEELSNMKFHVSVSKENMVSLSVAVDYWNSIFESLSQYNPIVRFGNSVKSDFEYIRSFDQILFQHGTLAWWGATLSHASKVGVYGPWRPIKIENNKNLGKTDYEGWFSWGGLKT